MKKLPLAPLENVVVQILSRETLVYNLSNDKAFCLNETAGIVYNHCDGVTTFAELERKYKFSEELIYLALEGLKKENLLGDFVSPLAGLSRREAVRRVGLASMIALPVIASLIAPTAVMARSSCTPPGQACAPTDFTQGDCCDNNRCYSFGTCQACYANGTQAVISAPGTYTNTSCNAMNIKRACCGTTFVVNGDGSGCVCQA